MSTEVDVSGTWEVDNGVRLLVGPSSTYIANLRSDYQAATGPGTPPYEQQQALTNLQNLLPQLGPALAQAQTDAANYPNLSALTDRQTVIVRLINNTALIAQGVDYLLKHLQLPGA